MPHVGLTENITCQVKMDRFFYAENNPEYYHLGRYYTLKFWRLILFLSYSQVNQYWLSNFQCIKKQTKYKLHKCVQNENFCGGAQSKKITKQELQFCHK